MSSEQLQAAAMMTSMPPKVDTTQMEGDPLGISGNIQTTPAPYVDFSDELLFDPDELDLPTGTGGYGLPGDAIVPIKPTSSGTGDVPPQAKSTATLGGTTETTTEPVVINLIDEKDNAAAEKSSGGFLGMNWWQSALSILGLVVCCLLMLVLFFVFPRSGGGGSSTQVDPFLGPGGGTGAFGGYGGSGF